MRVAAIASRNPEAAADAFRHAGVSAAASASSAAGLEDGVHSGKYVVSEDAGMLCRAGNIDVILEATGAVEFGAQLAVEAIRHGKHFIANAELDATLGPVLSRRAQAVGVVYSGLEGDQPGAEMNLYRFVKSLGFTPLLCGNIKGLHDPYRTPETQEVFARSSGLSPVMATNFADGSKISFEQATVANATGMCVARRGMLGYEHHGHVDELTSRYDVRELRALGGIVDYVLGAKPSPGVFILAAQDDATERSRLRLYKMGDGPLYSFYAPYHLAHFEVPLGIARAALFHDAVIAPMGAPKVEVVATAKKPLRPGDTLDGIGGFSTYGQCENPETVQRERLLPMGIAAGCRVARRIERDQVLTYADVLLPADRTCDQLRREQESIFAEALATAAD
jgi:predicted homoserine dehydrogenase-like protein